MEWVETTGKTLEEAKEAALDQLGVAADDAEFEVLAEAKMGLFGRLREEAHVRARVRPAIPRQKEDTRDRRRRTASKAKDGAADAPAVVADDAEPAAETAEVDGARTGRGGRGRSSGRANGSNAAVAAGVDETEANKVDGTREGGREVGREGGTEVPVADQAEEAKSFVLGLLAVMELQGDAAIRLLDDETAEVAVTGGDLGLLIGPKGATLSAVQDLMRTVVQRKTGARHGRLLLDVAGYRAKRKEALERFTTKVAADVVSGGTAIALEPMSAPDRKIVHDTANDIEGVTTSSQGEDPHRRVVISPA